MHTCAYSFKKLLSCRHRRRLRRRRRFSRRLKAAKNFFFSHTFLNSTTRLAACLPTFIKSGSL